MDRVVVRTLEVQSSNQRTRHMTWRGGLQNFTARRLHSINSRRLWSYVPLSVSLRHLFVLFQLLVFLPLKVFDPLLELHLCHLPRLLLAVLLLQLFRLELLQLQSLLSCTVFDLQAGNRYYSERLVLA